ncbi:hypothetical protein MPSEU_000620300 [Mayamaea pseudoterrestris]|nr:hypothetical protein MPSEU_000620300 [Mayamaea pseudoterrestris]
MAADTSSLADLLSHSKALHESSKLSLVQLVPVHFSLLRVAGVKSQILVLGDCDDASVSDGSRATATASWSELLKFLREIKDGAEDTNDACKLFSAEKLFVFQFMLLQSSHSTTAGHHPLQAITSLMLPVIEYETKLQQQDSDFELSDDIKLQEKELEELMEAILEAVFAQAADESLSVSSSNEQMQECLNQLYKFASRLLTDGSTCRSSSLAWKTLTRILTRLYEHQVQQQQQCGDEHAAFMLLQAIASQVEQGIQAAVQTALSSATSSFEQSASLSWLMPPITNDLLPLLVSSSPFLAEVHPDGNTIDSDSTPLTKIRIQVLQLYRQERVKPERFQQAGVYLVVTSVLCILLPSVTLSELQHNDATDLWDLIYLCVSQGLDAPRRGSSWNEHQSSLSQSTLDGSVARPTDTLRLAADSGTLQLLRRRGLYLLRILVQTIGEPSSMAIWSKYVACYETLEMESTPHLVDQTWATIADIASNISVDSELELENNKLVSSPLSFSWKWLKVMLARVLTTHEAPTVRKLSLFRLFVGEAGILLTQSASQQSSMTMIKASDRDRQRKVNSRPSKSAGKQSRGAPMTVVSPDFVLESVLLSMDTLEASVGTNIHFNNDKKESRQDMMELFATFLCSYIRSLQDNASRCKEFFLGLLAPEILCQISRKTVKLVFTCIADICLESGARFKIFLDDEVLTTVSKSLHFVMSAGAVPLDYQKSILESLSIMLANGDTNSAKALNPLTILGILDLFPVPDIDETSLADETQEQRGAESPWPDLDPTFDNVRKWLGGMRTQDPSWRTTFGAGVAAAYIDGALAGTATTRQWDPLVGLSTAEKEMGKAIIFFCSLVTAGEQELKTAAELIWPAIHKGLSNAPVAISSVSYTGAEKVAKAVVLLEYGCKLRVISGMGNGDLLVDRKMQTMMPPPQHIETLLKLATKFILHGIRVLLPSATNATDLFKSSNARSPVVRQATASFGRWINVLHTLHEGFPSSAATSETIHDLLQENVTTIISEATRGGESTAVTLQVAAIFASLTSGGQIPEGHLIDVCDALASIEYVDEGLSAVEEQASRSIFQAAKWGSLSILLKRLLMSSEHDTAKQTMQRILEKVNDSIHLVSLNAIQSLFTCVILAAEYTLTNSTKTDSLDNVIRTLTSLMDETKTSSESSEMLDAICGLVFRPELVMIESKRLLEDPDCLAPIRDAFRDFIKQAGSQRTYIAAAVLCRIIHGWLGPNDKPSQTGIAAIPYRDDIASLLVFKEARMDDACVNKSFQSQNYSEVLPLGTDDRSVTRGFAIAFLSRLPGADEGLSPLVLSDLCHFLVRFLLDDLLTQEKMEIRLGSSSYCRRMRSLQALCVLSRFVTADIAEEVCKHVMQVFEDQLYGQIRYFLEVFTIQCARKFPEIFGRALLHDIRRVNLSLQHISSICIVVGALTCGRYQMDYFTNKENVGTALSGVLPWLGSTQGFARAIAQLLVHRLIPFAIDVSIQCDDPVRDSDWYLRSVYSFLDTHEEMKRLRAKQTKFFETYDADTACTLDGIMQLTVDEGGEAFPAHLVAVMKDTLKEVFAEGNADVIPEWKQVEMMMSKPGFASGASDSRGEVEVNFQRKIIPLDALNLALENEQDRKRRNRAGRRKQPLIVCASLIDKAPNLAGLARTAEIFAADRLVIPERRVTQMDNFKSISVTAADWIDIEECKEVNLLSWLRKHKRNGWFVVGLEQTSSSISLEQFRFPDRPIILLLGKEKEGIPVEFLDAVDQCVEIPQLGIIRSLNVHVSGAIAIWEQTRQRLTNGKINLS